MASENKKKKLKNSRFFKTALKHKKGTMKRRLFFTSTQRQENKKENG